MSSPNISSGQAFAVFVENALGAPLAEIGRIALERPGELIARRDAVSEAMVTSWSGVGVDSLPQVSDGQLRPMYGKGLMTQRGTLSSHFTGTDPSARLSIEVKALLLYAHSVVVLNPLTPWFDVIDGVLHEEGPMDDMAFVRALHSVAELDDLLHEGVVEIVDPPRSQLSDVDLTDALAQAALDMPSRTLLHDAADRFAATRDALIRLMTYSLVDPKGSKTAMAASPSLEADGVDHVLASLRDALDPGYELPPELARLSALFELSLPGVHDLDPTDMVTVRNDDAFVDFRADVRLALGSAAPDLRAGDVSAARLGVAEFMQARASALRSKSVHQRVWDSTVGGGITLAVGGALGAVADWRAALLSLLARGAYDTVRSQMARRDDALFRHYVAMSTPGDTNLPSAAALIRARRRRRG